jgi:TM2 domain-containing membrane protein YozV
VPQRERSLLAGFLSYLVPGLGQIYQGRIAKGLLFLVVLYGLFFYGMYLGSWSNVYLRDAPANRSISVGAGRTAYNLIDRLPFAGQFPIGVVAWPAIWQYKELPMPERWRSLMSTPPEHRLNELQSEGDKYWDLGWVYTVIAGVLNILVIYDAYAGPAFTPEAEEEPTRREEASA